MVEFRSPPAVMAYAPAELYRWLSQPTSAELLDNAFPDFPPAPPPISVFGAAAPPTAVSRFNLWYAGILTFLVGTLFQAFGANLQRWSAENESAELGEATDGRKRRWCERPKAIWGLVLFAGGGIICSVSLVFASEDLMAPLVLLLFIFNPLFAYYMNKEPFDWWTDGVCTAFVMLGVGLVEGFSPHSSSSYSVGHIEYLFQQSSCIGFFTVLLSFILTIYYFQRRIKRLVTLGSDGYPSDFGAGGTWCQSGFLSVSYGSLAGAIGGLNVTLTKVIFSLFVDVDGSGARAIFTSWVLYVVAVCVVITYILELQMTAHGLEQVGAMIFLPCFAVVEQLTIAMGGLLFFQDFNLFTELGAAMFALGNTIALVAVIVMAYLRLQTHGEASSLLRKKAGSLPKGDTLALDSEYAPKGGLCCLGC